MACVACDQADRKGAASKLLVQSPSSIVHTTDQAGPDVSQICLLLLGLTVW